VDSRSEAAPNRQQSVKVCGDPNQNRLTFFTEVLYKSEKSDKIFSVDEAIDNPLGNKAEK